MEDQALAAKVISLRGKRSQLEEEEKQLLEALRARIQVLSAELRQDEKTRYEDFKEEVQLLEARYNKGLEEVEAISFANSQRDKLLEEARSKYKERSEIPKLFSKLLEKGIHFGYPPSIFSLRHKHVREAVESKVKDFQEARSKIQKMEAEFQIVVDALDADQELETEILKTVPEEIHDTRLDLEYEEIMEQSFSIMERFYSPEMKDKREKLNGLLKCLRLHDKNLKTFDCIDGVQLPSEDLTCPKIQSYHKLETWLPNASWS